MRLICPNCGAQYEVPDDVIPTSGRDVQCSSCGHTWLETPGASAAAEADVPAESSTSVRDTLRKATAEVAEPAPPEPSASGNYSGSIDDAFADISPTEPLVNLPDTTTDFESAEGEETPTTAPRRRPVDVSVSEILKEEAAREVAARRNEMGAALEQQEDLGLPEAHPAAPPRQARPTETERLVRDMQRDSEAEVKASKDVEDHTSQAAVAATVTSAGSRKELLPDIEEINSSLRSNAERGDRMIPEPEEVEEEQRRGFRFGFLSVLVVILVLTGIYIFAPQLSKAVPSMAGALDSYVAGVDAARIWLDIKVQALLEAIRPAAVGPSE